MSLLTFAEASALISTSLGDADFQGVIDREEAWLAGRIGALTGERTDTFTPGIGDTSLHLRRRTDSVVLTDDGSPLVAGTDYLFTPSTGQIRRLVGYWSGSVTVTYTPSDAAEVKRAILELIRGTVGESGYDSETIGDYSYDRGASSGRLSRSGLARGILIRRPGYSLRLRTGWEPS
jgi:hypothetical protein